MTNFSKSFRYTTAIAISLFALSIANKANAQCIGSPTLNCMGVATGPIAVDAAITTLNVQAGATVTAGPNRVDAVTIVSDLITANIDGTIENTATGTFAGGLVTRNDDVDLIVNNNATGIVRVLGAGRAVTIGSDGINSSLINSLTINNDGLIDAPVSNAFAIAGGENADIITNSATGTINGNFSLLDGDDVITNDGTLNIGRIIFGTGNDTLTNNAGAAVNINSNFGNGAARLNKASGDFTVNNDGDIILTGTRTGADVIDGPRDGLLIVNNTGTIQNSGTGTGGKWAILSRGESNITNSGDIIGADGLAIAGVNRTMSDVITNTATGSIIGDIRLANDSDDTVTTAGLIDGRVLLRSGDDTFNINLDSAVITGNANGNGHTIGDTLNISSSMGDSTIDSLTYRNFEFVNLSGDTKFTTTGLFSNAQAVTLDGDTDLVISDGSRIRADTLAVTGATGNNDITVDDGGTLESDVALDDGADTLTINGRVVGDIDLGDADDILSINLNTGSYTGDADGGAHTVGDTLDITSGSTETLDIDRFTNFEGLTLAGGGQFNTTTTSSGTYDTVTLDAGTNLNLGSGSMLTSTGAFTNVGGNAITIGSDAILEIPSFTGQPDTLTFDVATDTSFGVLNITGGPVDLTGVNVTALISGAVTDDDEVRVATGTAPAIGLTAGAGQVFTDIPDTSLLFNFGIADGNQGEVTTSGDANSLFIISDKVFLIRQVIEEGNEANVGEVLEVLETIPPGIDDPQIQDVLGQMNSASDANELRDVLQAVLPVLDTGAFSAAQNVTGNTLRLVSDRLTVLRDHGGSATGLSSGDVTENIQMWGQVFGQNINQDERKEILGFDAHTRGVTIGLDTEVLGDNVTAGIALSYANTDVDSRNLNNAETDIDSYNVSLYGDYDLTQNTYLVGDIGYTYGDNEGTRFNLGGVAGLNADSDYGSHQGEVRVILGHDYQVQGREDIRITPKLQAHYIHYQNEDISETGAGGAGLNVESDALNSLEFGVGLDVRKDYTRANGGMISPEINVGYRYDVIGDALETTSNFQAGGPSFISEGADPDQDTFNIGTGVGYTAPDGKEFTFSYDYESKDEFGAHSALFRVAAPF